LKARSGEYIVAKTGINRFDLVQSTTLKRVARFFIEESNFTAWAIPDDKPDCILYNKDKDIQIFDFKTRKAKTVKLQLFEPNLLQHPVDEEQNELPLYISCIKYPRHFHSSLFVAFNIDAEDIDEPLFRHTFIYRYKFDQNNLMTTLMEKFEVGGLANYIALQPRDVYVESSYLVAIPSVCGKVFFACKREGDEAVVVWEENLCQDSLGRVCSVNDVEFLSERSLVSVSSLGQLKYILLSEAKDKPQLEIEKT